MRRYNLMIRVLRAAGFDCPAARYVVYGMLESGYDFAVVARGLALYLGLRPDVIIRELEALCAPEAPSVRFGRITMEVLESENRVHVAERSG